MDDQEIIRFFNNATQKDKNDSEALCAVETLIQFIKKNTNTTLRGLEEELKSAIKLLSTLDKKVTSISSACDMFIKFITLSSGIDTTSFEHCKEILIKRGEEFLNSKRMAKDKITSVVQPLGFKGKILTHSYSRVVLHVLKSMKKRNIVVYVTESQPDNSGKKMFEALKEGGIKTVLVLDAGVGYLMEQIDLVLMGAEMVCQNGGVINKIGSYTIALCANALNKPVYIAAESFKFSREIPLNNRDIPRHYMFPILREDPSADTLHEHPLVDYIPPRFVSYILSDIGILGPDAVCDVALNLYI